MSKLTKSQIKILQYLMEEGIAVPLYDFHGNTIKALRKRGLIGINLSTYYYAITREGVQALRKDAFKYHYNAILEARRERHKACSVPGYTIIGPQRVQAHQWAQHQKHLIDRAEYWLGVIYA